MLSPKDLPATTLWLTPAQPAKLVSRKVRIEVLGGPDSGRHAELPGPEVRVGSAPDCDLALRDPTVSRHHLTLRVEGERIRVIDFGSTNGTLLDGLSVRDAFARPDSRIQAGTSTLRLGMLPDVVEVPVSSRERFGALLGTSVAMRRVFAILERVAPTDTTLLVEGETGTGKELVAEGVHEESQRGAGPFVVFDCSAVSPNLIESELFGHVKGAFTGAIGDRAGAFEAADGGTLFLDEIGELPLDLQPKLLRALERREVRRVGSNQVKRVDVRIIAATNRSLALEVERGRFREDLYYRLAVIHLVLPPLRERPEDIPLLVAHFTRELGGATAAPLPETADQDAGEPDLRRERARAAQLRRPRPLPARPHPARAAGGLGAAQPAVPALTMSLDLSVPLKQARDRLIDHYELAYLREALNLTSGNITRAAELAGVNRKFIQRAMKRLGLRDRRDRVPGRSGLRSSPPRRARCGRDASRGRLRPIRAGRQECCTARKTRSGCGIRIVDATVRRGERGDAAGRAVGVGGIALGHAPPVVDEARGDEAGGLERGPRGRAAPLRAAFAVRDRRRAAARPPCPAGARTGSARSGTIDQPRLEPLGAVAHEARPGRRRRG